MGIRDSIAARAIASASALTVRSALNPVLWLCGIVTVPAVLIASVVPSSPWWLVALACTPVALAAIGFLFLLIFDRDRLQSENYQIRKQTLELIEQKGDLEPIDASTIEVIANPDYRALPGTDEGESR